MESKARQTKKNMFVNLSNVWIKKARKVKWDDVKKQVVKDKDGKPITEPWVKKVKDYTIAVMEIAKGYDYTPIYAQAWTNNEKVVAQLQALPDLEKGTLVDVALIVNPTQHKDSFQFTLVTVKPYVKKEDRQTQKEDNLKTEIPELDETFDAEIEEEDLPF